jgi:hypothetical protein
MALKKIQVGGMIPPCTERSRINLSCPAAGQRILAISATTDDEILYNSNPHPSQMVYETAQNQTIVRFHKNNNNKK